MSSPKILSVDDSRMIQTVVGKIFAAYDCQVIFASNGEEGLAVASREHPDIILLDVTMPVMDGFEMLAKVKADPILKKIPIVMLTAEAGTDNVIKIAKLGVRDYVVKPFTSEALLERVLKLIKLSPKVVEKVAPKTLDDAMTVAVVDDDAANIGAIQAALSDRPWTVKVYAPGPEAANQAVENPPDIILANLAVPARLVQSFLHLIRNDVKTQRIPIVGISGGNSTDDEGHQSGLVGVIPKPVDADALLEAIIQALKLEGQSRFFSVDGAVHVARLPKQLTPALISCIGRDFLATVRQMTSAGQNRFLVDASEVSEADVKAVDLIVRMLDRCSSSSIQARVTATSEFATQARTYAEMAETTFHTSRAQAISSFA